jgi:FADH2 O2-dependent halogenase
MSDKYDVIILGSGFAGAILASVLARHGGKVALVEAGTHPRFAIGESTIPQTSQMISLVARKYDVPELEDLGLGSPKGLRERVTSSCGIKRTFGFAYHELGKEHVPEQAHQFGNVFRDENHLFRQDIDAWLVQVAVRYGADLYLRTRAEGLEIDDHGVKVRTAGGGTLEGQYLVDGTGFRSVVADHYGLREEPARFAHHSRSLFSHMLDVAPFEDVATNRLSVKWSQGTLHHVFDRGWVWVIPFNNHEHATNQLVSVGLTVDPRVYPRDESVEPEEEFRCFLREHLPSASRQFDRARSMQPWVSTGRLQFSSTRSVGKRWSLMSHASGFLDALYSRGLINSIELVRATADPLLESIRDGDWSEERYEHLEARHRQVLDFADRIVHSSFVSWGHFDVWDWAVRIWAVAVGVAESNLGSYLFQGERADYQRAAAPLFSEFEHAGFRAFFETCEPAILGFRDGKLAPAQAADRLRAAFRDYDFRMKLPDGSHCTEWAIKNPLTRDWFIGSEACRKRWEARQDDAHQVGAPV